MPDKITLDRAFLRDEIVSPLTRIYAEIEDTLDGPYVEELEVVLAKLNEELKKSI